MKVRSFISHSEEDTFKIACDFAKEKIKSPLLIGLSGELGAGKTVFVKGIADFLEIKELITSPTFLGISEYYSGKIPLVHMDFYRKVIPLEIINSYKNSVIIIEWYENFKEVFNFDLTLDVSVYIEYSINSESNMRSINIKTQ